MPRLKGKRLIKKSTNYLTMTIILLAIVPLLILSSIIALIYSVNTTRQNMEYLEQTAESVTNYLVEAYNNSLEGITDVSETKDIINALKNPDDKESVDKAQSILDTVHLANNQIRSAFLISPDGKTIASSDESAMGKPVNAFIFQELSEGKDHASAIQFEKNQPFMRLGVRVYDEDNQYIGILTRLIELPMVRSIALQANEKDYCLILVGQNGESLQYLPDDNHYYGFLYNPKEETKDDYSNLYASLQHEMMSEPSGTFNYEYDDKTFLACFSTFEACGWTAVVSEPKAKLMFEINRFQLITIGLTLLAIVIIVIIARRLLDRLDKTNQESSEVLESYLSGDYTKRVKKNSLQSFNSVGDKINEVGELLNYKDQEISNFKREIKDAKALDQTTQLMSRSAIYSKIAQYFGHHQNQALILYNIGGYKELSDLYGKNFGAKIIEEVAELLKGSKREHVYIARLSEDDFLIFIAEFSQEEKVLEFVQDLITRTEAIEEIDGIQIAITGYAGIVYLDDSITSRTVWMQQVDFANTEAKKSNRHYYIRDEEESYTESDAENEMESAATQSLINSFLLRGPKDFVISGDSREDEEEKPESEGPDSVEKDGKEKESSS